MHECDTHIQMVAPAKATVLQVYNRATDSWLPSFDMCVRVFDGEGRRLDESVCVADLPSQPRMRPQLTIKTADVTMYRKCVERFPSLHETAISCAGAQNLFGDGMFFRCVLELRVPLGLVYKRTARGGQRWTFDADLIRIVGVWMISNCGNMKGHDCLRDPEEEVLSVGIKQAGNGVIGDHAFIGMFFLKCIYKYIYMCIYMYIYVYLWWHNFLFNY